MARSLEEIHDTHEAEDTFDDTEAAEEEDAGEDFEDNVLATSDRVNAQVAGTDVRVQEAVERAPMSFRKRETTTTGVSSRMVEKTFQSKMKREENRLPALAGEAGKDVLENGAHLG